MDYPKFVVSNQKEESFSIQTVNMRIELYINPFQTNGIFHKATYNNVSMVHCVYWGVTGYNLKKNIVFLNLKINFILANSADPDEMPPYAAFHQGLHCLLK